MTDPVSTSTPQERLAAFAASLTAEAVDMQSAADALGQLPTLQASNAAYSSQAVKDQASIAQLTTDKNAALASVTQLQTQHTADFATIAQLQATITQLQTPVTPTPPPVVPTPPAPVPPVVPSTVRFAGDPGKGKTYIGSSVESTYVPANMVARQTQYAAALNLPPAAGIPGVHRGYFGPGDVDKAVAFCKDRLASKALPLISFKTPNGWASLAAGTDDAWLNGINTKLAALAGPIWVAIHHEPETDGTPADFKAMSKHWLGIVKAPNLARLPILYAPNTVLKPPVNMDYADYIGAPGELPWNLLGWDNYPGRTDTVQKNWSLFLPGIDAVSTQYNLPYAVCETGCKQSTDDAVPNWLLTALTVLHGDVNCVGVAYFDSKLNSVADWSLAGNRLKNYTQATQLPGVVHIS